MGDLLGNLHPWAAARARRDLTDIENARPMCRYRVGGRCVRYRSIIVVLSLLLGPVTVVCRASSPVRGHDAKAPNVSPIASGAQLAFSTVCPFASYATMRMFGKPVESVAALNLAPTYLLTGRCQPMGWSFSSIKAITDTLSGIPHMRIGVDMR